MTPHFNVLGTLRVANGDQDCTPSPPKMRSVLALLLLSANRVVQMDSLIEELWGDESPQSAVTTVQTYIYHLRRIFAAKQLDPPGRPLLVTKQPGYLFQIDSEQVDAEVFERLVARGAGCSRPTGPKPRPSCWRKRSRCGPGQPWPTCRGEACFRRTPSTLRNAVSTRSSFGSRPTSGSGGIASLSPSCGRWSAHTR